MNTINTYLAIGIFFIHTGSSANCNIADNATQPFQGIYSHTNSSSTLDARTNLIWTSCLVGQVVGISPGTTEFPQGFRMCSGAPELFTWEEALAHVSEINRSNSQNVSNGWRLPNINELLSIADYDCSHPTLRKYAFPTKSSDWERYGGSQWTSTPFSGGIQDSSWIIDFFLGESFPASRFFKLPIRLVKN